MYLQQVQREAEYKFPSDGTTTPPLFVEVPSALYVLQEVTEELMDPVLF
jgi:hypothetical protein